MKRISQGSTVRLPSRAEASAPRKEAPAKAKPETGQSDAKPGQVWSGFSGAAQTGKQGPPGETELSPMALRTDLRAAFESIGPAAKAKAYRLDSNVEAFASRWDTLDKAEKSFDTTYFIWENDVFGTAFLGKLLSKAKQGLHIRAMMDATGDVTGTKGFKGTFRGQDYLQELVNVDPKRVQIGIYNPLLKKDMTSLKGIVASNHDKLAIADGKVLETGGRNMAAHYFSSPKDHKGVYRDTDIHVVSEAAAKQATQAFEVEFNNTKVTQQIKPDRFGNWNKKDIELLGAASMMDDWLHAPPFSEAEKAEIRTSHEPPKAIVDAVVQQVLAKLPAQGITREPSSGEIKALHKLATQLVSNPELRGKSTAKHESIDGEIRLLDSVSAAGDGNNEISPNLLKLIGSAKESILIHNPYIVLTDTALEALADAGKRGVQITFGTNSPESTDSALTQAYFQEDWPLILARIPNSRIITATGDQKHHAKTFVVDGVLSGISTYNADWISARVNSELVTLDWSEEFAKDTIASYEAMVDNPEHDMVEYNILRDESGRALVLDGKPVITFGPRDHTEAKDLEKYGVLRKGANWARANIRALSPIMHEPLSEAKDHVRVIDWRSDDESLGQIAKHSSGRRMVEDIIGRLESGWTTAEEAAQVERLQGFLSN
jgi:putative cardiolipin synthase